MLLRLVTCAICFLAFSVYLFLAICRGKPHFPRQRRTDRFFDSFAVRHFAIPRHHGQRRSSSQNQASSNMTSASGIVAALSAPFLLDVGFLIWDKHWKGSSFALNLYKCSLASVGFLILSFVTRPPGATTDNPPFPAELFTVNSVGFLMLSSTIGILIGDWTWLEALQLIGARPVVLMDSVKPFLAALLGWWILGENLQWPAFIGMALTVGGVVWVSLERESSSEGDEDDNDDKTEEREECKEGANTDDEKNILNTSDRFDDNGDENEENQTEGEAKESLKEKKIRRATTPNDIRKGYALSVLNVVLDTYGSLLTKQHGVGMSTWNISLIRFGFAAAFCIILSSILNLRQALIRSYRPKGANSDAGLSNIRAANDINANGSLSLRGSVLQLMNFRLGKDVEAQKEEPTDLHQNRSKDGNNGPNKAGSIDNEPPWYSLPRMSRRSYGIISVGVAFTTFATPALSNYALFQIALALALTLGSMGPVYMLPLSWVIQGEKPTVRSCLGAVLAVAGVAILSFFGK